MSEKKTRKAGMDLGRVLLWSAVLVEAPRWAGSMLAADVEQVTGALSVLLNGLNTLSGLAMGFVNVIATAYILDALRREKPTLTVTRKGQAVEKRNLRFTWLAGFGFGLLALTPLVLAPFVVSRMTGDTMATVLATRFWQFAWATAVIVSPIFVIGGVSFAQPGLVTMKVSETSAESEAQVAEKPRKVAKDLNEKPETFGRFKNWHQVPREHREKIAGLLASLSRKLAMEEVRKQYGVSERSAYDWLKYAGGLTGEDGGMQKAVGGEK